MFVGEPMGPEGLRRSPRQRILVLGEEGLEPQSLGWSSENGNGWGLLSTSSILEGFPSLGLDTSIVPVLSEANCAAVVWEWGRHWYWPGPGHGSKAALQKSFARPDTAAW